MAYKELLASQEGQGRVARLQTERPHITTPGGVVVAVGFQKSADAMEEELRATPTGRQLLADIHNHPMKKKEHGVAAHGSVRSDGGFVKLASRALAQQVGPGSSCRSRLCPPAPATPPSPVPIVPHRARSAASPMHSPAVASQRPLPRRGTSGQRPTSARSPSPHEQVRAEVGRGRK